MAPAQETTSTDIPYLTVVPLYTPCSFHVETPKEKVVDFFKSLIARKDIALILINQHVRVRPRIIQTRKCNRSFTFPTFPLLQLLLFLDLHLSFPIILAQICESIRHVLALHTALLPAVLEIPSKEHPYDESTDPMMIRVKKLLGGADDS